MTTMPVIDDDERDRNHKAHTASKKKIKKKKKDKKKKDKKRKRSSKQESAEEGVVVVDVVDATTHDVEERAIVDDAAVASTGVALEGMIKRRRVEGASPEEGPTSSEGKKRTKEAKRSSDENGDGGPPGRGDVDAKRRDEKRKKKKKEKHRKKLKDSKVRKKRSSSDSSTSSADADDDDVKRQSNAEKPTGQSTKSVNDSVVGGRIISSSAVEFLPSGVIASKDAAAADDDDSNRAEATKGGSNGHSKTKDGDDNNSNNITLLLFYQYVEPPWDNDTFQTALQFVEETGQQFNLTGRMRVAREGLNCTLTGSHSGIRSWCASLRTFHNGEFANTEFKLTDDLPPKQRFPKLHAFEVTELVHYGLAGKRAPPIAMTGTHLEPSDYHRKIAEPDTVIIDVRNHYEAAIGRFDPPTEGAQMIDPLMRKSTEFPVWLDKPETKEKLRGKQVLMYCTGGVRCERASALLRQKIETEDDTKDLGIKGVYQLQGGIDKYFKKFPDGGFWKGKNYVFDKRFAHAPPKVEAVERVAKLRGMVQGSSPSEGDAAAKGHAANDDAEATASNATDKGDDGGGSADAQRTKRAPIEPPPIMGRCEACRKPWDMYRGKRRCPTCGVPSLICRDCMMADKSGIKKLDQSIRCDLCVRENVTSKHQVKERDKKELMEYERKMREMERRRGDDDRDDPKKERRRQRSRSRGWSGDDIDNVGGGGYAAAREGKMEQQAVAAPAAKNPDGVTRLFLKNMCAKRMDERTLMSTLKPAKVTHIQWITDRTTGKFYGSAFVEMANADDAASVVARNGQKVLGRPLKVKYQPPNPKDIWPPPNSAVF